MQLFRLSFLLVRGNGFAGGARGGGGVGGGEGCSNSGGMLPSNAHNALQGLQSSARTGL